MDTRTRGRVSCRDRRMQIDFASFPFHCATVELDIKRFVNRLLCSCIRDIRVDSSNYFSFVWDEWRGMNAMRISKRIDQYFTCNALLLFYRMKYKIH